jgi:putative addiction module component (TIGR02574 family)
MRTNPLFDFSRLTAAERIQLAQDLWDSLEPAEIDAECPLTDEQQAEIARRLADLEAHPEASIPWEQVRAELERDLQADRGRPAPRKRGA